MYGLDQTGREWTERAAVLTEQVALPAAADVDRHARFPKESIEALGEQGFLGLVLPEDFGGAAQPPRVFAAVVEELALGCPSTAMVYVMHVSAAQAIASSATLAVHDELLSEIADGKHLTTLAISERGSRSQFWAPVSTLEPSSGGNGYVASAVKSWVTSAAHANSYVASSQRPGGDLPLDSILYLVRRDSECVQIGGGFDGLGLRGNDSSPVTLDSLTISRDALLSEPEQQSTLLLEVVLPWFAVGTAAMADGLCRAAVAATTAHLRNTGFEHDGSRLRDLPNLRARLAQMSTRTEQSRALLAHTVAAMEQPDEMTPLYVLQTRLAAIEAALAVTDLAMKACGGAAFSKHLGIERLFRDARAGWVMAPTADHLYEFIGRALTGLPLFE